MVDLETLSAGVLQALRIVFYITPELLTDLAVFH